MKGKLLKIKSLFKTKGFSRNNFILTVVALVEIIAIMIVSTSAWVETISTVQISGVSGSVLPARYTTVTFDGTQGNIDLSQYFNESGNAHLCSASSSNGSTFFFPRISNTANTVYYRQGTIDDTNVNYISFTIRINSTLKTNDYYFAEKPSIKIGDQEVTDSSVRIAITAGGETKMFSLAEAADPAVASVNGDGVAAKITPTISTFDTYLGSSAAEPIFTAEHNVPTDVTFTLWLEDPSLTSSYSGKSVEISNFNLITAEHLYDIKFIDRTTSYNSSSSGLYWVQNENAKMWAYDSASGLCVELLPNIDNSVSADWAWSAERTEWVGQINDVFIDNANSNLYFIRTSPDTVAADINPSDSTTYWNKWTTKLADDNVSQAREYTAYSNIVNSGSDKQGTWGDVIDISLDTKDSDSLTKPADESTASKVTLKINNISYEMNYKNVGGTAVWRSYIPTENSTSDITFSVANGSNTYTYNATGRDTSRLYVITSTSTGYWDPPVTVVVVSSDSNMGTVSVSGGKAGDTTVDVTKGTTVTLTATPKTGYGFVGWYTNTGLTEAAVLTNGNQYKADAGKTFYAKFQKNYHIQLTAVTGTTTGVTTGGSVQFNTETAAAKVDKYVFENGVDNVNVTFTAVQTTAQSAAYDFLGWFTNASGIGNPAYTTKEISVPLVNQDLTYYAIYKLKTFTVTAVAKPDGTIGGSTVTFDSPSGADTGTTVTVEVGYNNSAIFRANPDTANGYEFKGWYDNAACTGNALSTDNPYTVSNITAAVTRYAKFELKDITVAANAVTGTAVSSTGGTVKIDSGTAGATVTATKKYGNSYTLTATPSSGYEFQGWYTAATGGSAVTTGLASGYTYTNTTIMLSNITANTTVYARFAKQGTTVYLKLDNSDWTNNNERYAVYLWGTSGGPIWYNLEGPDEYGCYSITYTEDYTNIIFCRMNKDISDNKWNDSTSSPVWNQTVDLTVDTTNNCFVLKTKNSDGKYEGDWVSYPPSGTVSSSVTITFKDSTSGNWIKNDDARMFMLVDGVAKEMSTTDSKVWTLTLTSTPSSIDFYRCTRGGYADTQQTDANTTNAGYYNKWTNTGYSSGKTTYTVSDSSTGWS